MLVVKRDGRKESVKFDKITARIEKLCYGFNLVTSWFLLAVDKYGKAYSPSCARLQRVLNVVKRLHRSCVLNAKPC
jgi:hypothetical protein